MLSTLAVKVAEDPFVKIKGMIQDMIEKLLEEEAGEANHKGYCDEEISKTVKDRDYRLEEIEALHASLEEADEANHKGYCDEEIAKTVKDRDYRLRDIDALNSHLEKLNARTAKLTLTKGELEAEILELTTDYMNQTAARAAEK